ncbi:NAD(P)-dependent oxidoreductase [Vagococcus acidifermentans]|uniref:NAD(P)-binding domain-containing protein n=1 Tax=Vagococcus acidifermentans TaxID=564710 RepID=A0A430B2K3_9ENTE|nr:NAD(P)H-binding protein [Vagococcus acidifermentans]RSU14560.1 hypothetical protein CBF27_00825 [Vagococcus acidifermentans]
MEKVAVLGASGKVGGKILMEAKKRGLDVTAIVRDASKAPEDTAVLVRDVYELTTDDIQPFDVLVNALGFWGDSVTEFSPSTKHLLSILNGTGVRLLVVGGASSLYMDASHSMQLRETPDFPKSFYPLGTEMSKSLDLIRQSTGVDWTYLSPAREFSPKLPRTGSYVIAGEELTFDADGNSKLSYDDFAIAMVDEIIAKKYPNQRISVRW